MPFMVSTTCPTTSPPRMATPEAACASWLAWWALSAFWRTVLPISSMVAEVCSSALACCSVRWLRSALPWAICELAVATLSALFRTSDTTRARETCISSIAASSWLVSSRPDSCTVVVRSPSRMWLARSIARDMGCVMLRVISQAATEPNPMASAVSRVSSIVARLPAACAAASASSIDCFCNSA